MTITEFLLARITEDEAAARAGISGQADPENGWGYEGRALIPHVGIIHDAVQAAHIIRWHPYRVLAECAAKRVIVTEVLALEHDMRLLTDPLIFAQYKLLHQWLIRPFAAVYEDHQDYRREWKS